MQRQEKMRVKMVRSLSCCTDMKKEVREEEESQ
jgi:hypothetical protein